MYLHRDPDYVVYLEVSHPEIVRRRGVRWGPGRLGQQRERLRTAREDADLIIATDGVKPDDICRRVLDFVRKGAS